jgi:endonuclease/exonuclease/phosphatase family metal-dependent hydrolase
VAGEEELTALACRVATWNLWWRFGDWQARFEAIAAVLREAAPDVVGLQEVGNAVLSRWPVAGVAHADLPAPASGAPDGRRRYAAPGDRGITWSRGNPHAAMIGEPDARIDYVLVGTPRVAGAALVRGARVVGDGPVDGVWPSDHAAVVVDLRLGDAGYVGPGAG